MATFNKRGYKEPKPKAEKLDNNYIEDVNVDAKDSATAKAFDTLDQSASRAEDFVAKNQKYILGFLTVVALATVSYLLYQKFIAEPSQEEAASELFVAQQNFQKAVDATGTKSDSLYNLVLKGSEGKFGVVKIADEYSGTDAGNLANYYAGVAYLNTKKYAEAITSLEKFKSDDIMLSTIAIGVIGDSYAGGILGRTDAKAKMSLKAVRASGSVRGYKAGSANKYFGGIIGQSHSSGGNVELQNLLAFNSVSTMGDNTTVGTLVGEGPSGATDSFYAQDITNQAGIQGVKINSGSLNQLSYWQNTLKFTFPEWDYSMIGTILNSKLPFLKSNPPGLDSPSFPRNVTSKVNKPIIDGTIKINNCSELQSIGQSDQMPLSGKYELNDKEIRSFSVKLTSIMTGCVLSSGNTPFNVVS